MITEKNKNKEQIAGLFSTCRLGDITEMIPVTGGHMHEMYRVSTPSAVYAVKCLNPLVMCRPEARDNMAASEKIVRLFQKYLPVCPAKEINGDCLLTYEGGYYMIFDWIDGAPVYPPKIGKKHCAEIGTALGKMHSLQLSVPGLSGEPEPTPLFAWEHFLHTAAAQKPVWLETYSAMTERLLLWNKAIRRAEPALAAEAILSHRDLDPKNVLWHKDQYVLVDWESAGYVNPYQELLEVLLAWSDDGTGRPEQDKFSTMLRAYARFSYPDEADWDTVLLCGRKNMLAWLEYNLKRALGLECASEKERLLGDSQVCETLSLLEQYDKMSGILKKWLNRF